MAGEYAFTIKDLRKVVPPKREILRGIYLSFFHGAKIGVLGANGAGKSSLLRIMAGVDDDFLGEAFPADGLRIGYLPQEPALDPAKDVRGNVEDGVGETRALLTRFEEVSAMLRSIASRVVSAAGWRCAACCCPSRTCCYWTSPPITSTPSRWPGWSAS